MAAPSPPHTRPIVLQISKLSEDDLFFPPSCFESSCFSWLGGRVSTPRRGDALFFSPTLLIAMRGWRRRGSKALDGYSLGPNNG